MDRESASPFGTKRDYNDPPIDHFLLPCTKRRKQYHGDSSSPSLSLSPFVQQQPMLCAPEHCSASKMQPHQSPVFDGVLPQAMLPDSITPSSNVAWWNQKPRPIINAPNTNLFEASICVVCQKPLQRMTGVDIPTKLRGSEVESHNNVMPPNSILAYFEPIDRNQNHLTPTILTKPAPIYPQATTSITTPIQPCVASCSFCERVACQDCSVKCAVCGDVFCYFCSTTDYKCGGTTLRIVCLDCQRQTNHSSKQKPDSTDVMLIE